MNNVMKRFILTANIPAISHIAIRYHVLITGIRHIDDPNWMSNEKIEFTARRQCIKRVLEGPGGGLRWSISGDMTGGEGIVKG